MAARHVERTHHFAKGFIEKVRKGFQNFFLPAVCVITSFLYGEPSHFFSFSELSKASKYHNQWIHIRGFLYQRENGEWIIAKEPNLKTCCLGSKQALCQQIVVNGDLSGGHLNHAVTVQGRLYARPTWDHEGDFVGTFHLEEAKIIPEQKNQRATTLLSIALAMGMIGIALAVVLPRIKFQ